MIKNAPNRVIVSVDMEKKNQHTFADGTTIRLERQYNNLNRRETEPVNAIVISSDSIPAGSEIIIHHNATHPTYQIFNYGVLSGEQTASPLKYFSVLEEHCFLYREQGSDQWLPCNNFVTGLRVFKPYEGSLVGIEPASVKNKLYVTSGYLKGKVVSTLIAADYEMVFQGLDGREQRIIRCRHYKDEINAREEIVGIDNYSTNLLNLGKLLVGLTPTDAKTIKDA